MKKLSLRQKEIYEFIKEYLEDNSYPPTQSEIAIELGLSQQTIREYLLVLSKKGYINWIENIPRSIKVIL